MMIRFSRNGNTETKQSAKAAAAHAGRFDAFAGANGWYDHAKVTRRMALDRCRRLNQRRRHGQTYIRPACEVWGVRITRAVAQQNGLEGVTSEEKASLGGSW
jgi:hypothetical protein